MSAVIRRMWRTVTVPTCFGKRVLQGTLRRDGDGLACEETVPCHQMRVRY